MAEISPRTYQTQACDDVEKIAVGGRKRVLVVAPTGAGKTVIAAEMVRRTLAAGGRVVFLAHHRELIAQAAAKLFAVGIDAAIIMAGFPMRPGVAVQVASVQTLHARAVRGSAIEMPPADLVIVDEAHHVRARTYRQILDAYPDAAILGITATPTRGDGRGLGNVFDHIVETPQIAELIALGYLVPTIVYAPSVPDLRGVAVSKGDYVHAALEQRMDTVTLVADMVTEYLRVGRPRRAVAFASGVGHSLHMCAGLQAAGIRAAHLDGTTPAEERDGILRRLDAGELDVVTNYGVLTEGWDSPSVSCCILVRPTKSMSLYRQMAGRVLRPAPGKENALILDHAGLTFAHGFVEDEVHWTLKEDHRAVNVTHAARRAEAGAQSLSACPKCRAVRVGGKPCTACGWRPQPRPMHVDVADGELARLDRDGRQTANVGDRLRWYCALKYIAREKGYADGWISHKFKEKFGDWPNDGWRKAPPSVPEPHVRSWVKSRQIAFAKRMDRARGAA